MADYCVLCHAISEKTIISSSVSEININIMAKSGEIIESDILKKSENKAATHQLNNIACSCQRSAIISHQPAKTVNS